MAAAALRPMMAAAREEAAIISSEAGVAARTSVTAEAGAAVRAAGKETFNPLAVREAAESAAQRAVQRGESGLLNGLAHGRPETPTKATTTAVSQTVLSELGVETSTSTITTHTVGEGTIIGQTLQHDLGVTLRETMSNAGETGVQQLTMQAAEAGETFLEGRLHNSQAAAQMGAKHAHAEQA